MMSAASDPININSIGSTKKHIMSSSQLPSSLKRRIIEKIGDNKLTIIVGPTGCGECVHFLLLQGNNLCGITFNYLSNN